MADMASAIREKSEDRSKSEPDHSVKMAMLPGKRSIEYKLLKVRRFVNAKMLYKFDQFFKISCDKQWIISAFLKFNDHFACGYDDIDRGIKEKMGLGIDL